ncbi:MAG: hypothetical protein QGH99_02580 [Pseudomonadales bacterium]|jgi:hypothetical protein|nr:hypothetical protein [Pseudomonadales bacterium]MDP6316150.1 hypothetical protein [Pseudomonadales bacterium]MDP7315620.1 hypothetical protein [Pseudomonadales bacterium]MDP7575824.1 hypothetical protein [Pseudomonadales bacterium]HJP52858.1 hypothetical protein [Pseudomonadales bacterium]
MLHWQGMIWDHLSNLNEQDIQSLIVYPQNMPAVGRSVPDTTPPSTEDCSEYTFYLEKDDRPDCTH